MKLSLSITLMISFFLVACSPTNSNTSVESSSHSNEGNNQKTEVDKNMTLQEDKNALLTGLIGSEFYRDFEDIKQSKNWGKLNAQEKLSLELVYGTIFCADNKSKIQGKEVECLTVFSSTMSRLVGLAAKNFREVTLVELKTDHSLLGQRIKTNGLGMYVLNMLMIRQNPTDMSPVGIDIQNLETSIKQMIVEKCSDLSSPCQVMVAGKVEKVTPIINVVAEDLMFVDEMKFMTDHKTLKKISTTALKKLQSTNPIMVKALKEIEMWTSKTK